MNTGTADALLFFRAWLSAPLRVASVTPSGRALSSLMTAEISAKTGTVIELGPGTGVFTDALIGRGVAEENLVLIEYGAEFANQLSHRYPSATTVQMDAAQLRKLPFRGSAPVGAVVSGLPVLSMPTRKVHAILEGAFWHLGRRGAFYQFTYGLRCPIARPLLERLGLKATYMGCTFANIPPAGVYRISRRKPRSDAADYVSGQLC
jgi:phosphatidylethanolamine/phosphatidyl-N-methylethanolamine N-methyltransferase